MNKRVRKKRQKQNARRSVRSPYEPKKSVVSLPCPQCEEEQLKRTHVPAMGSMNGTVKCACCDYEAPYVDALARVMDPEDPLPVGFYRRSVQKAVEVTPPGHWEAFKRWARRMLLGAPPPQPTGRPDRIVYHASCA